MLRTAALLITLTAFALVTPSADAINKPLVLRVAEVGGGNVRIDAGQVGSSVGDRIVLSHRIHNLARQLGRASNADVGVSRGACTVLRVHIRWFCQWQLVLPNGDVLLSGVVDVNNRRSRVGVIGGTGAYMNARGMAFRFPTGRVTQWQLRLVP